MDEIDRQVDEIIKLLEENDIPAAAEYFPDDTETPYAVVLTPSSRGEYADMGVFSEVLAEYVNFRIELFTINRSDPIRKIFKDLIIGNIHADKFTAEEQSFGANDLYMTAIEFERVI